MRKKERESPMRSLLLMIQQSFQVQVDLLNPNWGLPCQNYRVIVSSCESIILPPLNRSFIIGQWFLTGVGFDLGLCENGMIFYSYDALRKKNLRSYVQPCWSINPQLRRVRMDLTINLTWRVSIINFRIEGPNVSIACWASSTIQNLSEFCFVANWEYLSKHSVFSKRFGCRCTPNPGPGSRQLPRFPPISSASVPTIRRRQWENRHSPKACFDSYNDAETVTTLLQYHIIELGDSGQSVDSPEWQVEQ